MFYVNVEEITRYDCASACVFFFQSSALNGRFMTAPLQVLVEKEMESNHALHPCQFHTLLSDHQQLGRKL